LEISKLHEVWSKSDINRLNLELAKIVSPFTRNHSEFDIFVQSNEFNEFNAFKKIESTGVECYSDSFLLKFDKEKGMQETLYFDSLSNKLLIKSDKIFSFGGITLQLYHFNEKAKKEFNAKFNHLGIYIDGIKIYRDGIIVTAFAEPETKQDNKKDILGIDKRLWRSTFDKVGTREIIGFLDISKENNPTIEEATNRQDFINNPEYKELKRFIINQLQQLEEYKKWKRQSDIAQSESSLKKAEEAVNQFVNEIDKLTQDNPLIGTAVSGLKVQAIRAGKAIKEGIKQSEKIKKEAERRENIYLSLMSLQDYAANVAHAVRTSLSAVKEYADFFKQKFPNSKYDDLFMKYAIFIFEEMQKMDKAIDFMLSYAGSNNIPEDFNLKELLMDLLTIHYKPRFEKENIRAEVLIKENVPINANKQFITDIFQNLIANSIKALIDTTDKVIKCSGHVENGQFICLFSDNGHGVKEEDKNSIFDLYFTTTADRGGAGLGLYIVKTRLEALKGSISLVESEFSPNGATFKITLPFNKK
jgi:signal transduction histidine kinase